MRPSLMLQVSITFGLLASLGAVGQTSGEIVEVSKAEYEVFSAFVYPAKAKDHRRSRRANSGNSSCPYFLIRNCKLVINLHDPQNPSTGGSIAGMSQPGSKSSEPQTVTPVMNCKIRSKDGSWLWRFSVSKKGLPFQVTDWQGVVARPKQYVFTFEFIDLESSAWIGPYRLAQFLRRMLSERDKIQTETVELN